MAWWRWLGGRGRCARAPAARAQDEAGQRLDDPRDADGDEQRRDLVGDEDAGAEADQRPQPEDEQAQRQRPEDAAVGERRVARARSARWRPRRPTPTSEMSAVDGADAQQGDHLGAHDPHPAWAWPRKVLVIVLWRYSAPIGMTPMASVSR